MSNPKMSDAQRLRKAAKYMRANGYSPYINCGQCGCFLHALVRTGTPFAEGIMLWPRIESVVGTDFRAAQLKDAGWTHGQTDDAVAALEIAADIAEAG